MLISGLNLGSEVERGFLSRVRALRDYLKHDYRRMCVNALSTSGDLCSAWLCIPYALSSLTDSDFGCPCAHVHTTTHSKGQDDACTAST